MVLFRQSFSFYYRLSFCQILPTLEYPTDKLIVSANGNLKERSHHKGYPFFLSTGPTQTGHTSLSRLKLGHKGVGGSWGAFVFAFAATVDSRKCVRFERLKILNLAVDADGGPVGSCCCFSLTAGELTRTQLPKPTRTHRQPIRIVL